MPSTTAGGEPGGLDGAGRVGGEPGRVGEPGRPEESDEPAGDPGASICCGGVLGGALGSPAAPVVSPDPEPCDTDGDGV